MVHAISSSVSPISNECEKAVLNSDKTGCVGYLTDTQYATAG